YPVTVSASGFASLNLQAAVTPGADTTVTAQMGVSPGEFTGTVTNNGAAVAGAIVEALFNSLIQGTAVTDANGSYALFLPGGTYNLTVSASGDITNTVAAQSLAANAVSTVNLTIQRLGNIPG